MYLSGLCLGKSIEMPEQWMRQFFFGMPYQNVLVDDLFRLDDPYGREAHVAQTLAHIAIVIQEYRSGDQRLDRFPLDLPALSAFVADRYGNLLIKPDAAHQVFLGER